MRFRQSRTRTYKSDLMDEKLLDSLVDEAIEKMTYWKWSSFCISTNIPKEWMSGEEEEWDKKFDDSSQSVKNQVNSFIIKKICSATKKKYDPLNADGKLVFDLQSKKLSVEFEPVFIFGRYHKLEPGLSQSRWVCGKCEGDGCFKCDWKGKYYVSVEELMGEPIKEVAQASNYFLHASGREDVDVVNLAGRPFVLELEKPKIRNLNLKDIENQVNLGKKILIQDLKFVSRGFVEAVTESHFEKEYEAEVEFSEDVNKKIVNAICDIAGRDIVQRTPKRVAHRRADLKREREILFISCVKFEGNTATFRILAEAGTYIKELINGDGGRTETSFAGVSGFQAKCVNLKLIKIHDDFLDFILS